MESKKQIEKMKAALGVITTCPEIARWLLANDPKAYHQCLDALDPDEIEITWTPRLGGEFFLSSGRFEITRTKFGEFRLWDTLSNETADIVMSLRGAKESAVDILKEERESRKEKTLFVVAVKPAGRYFAWASDDRRLESTDYHLSECSIEQVVALLKEQNPGYAVIC